MFHPRYIFHTHIIYSTHTVYIHFPQYIYVATVYIKLPQYISNTHGMYIPHPQYMVTLHGLYTAPKEYTHGLHVSCPRHKLMYPRCTSHRCHGCRRRVQQRRLPDSTNCSVDVHHQVTGLWHGALGTGPARPGPPQ